MLFDPILNINWSLLSSLFLTRSSESKCNAFRRENLTLKAPKPERGLTSPPQNPSILTRRHFMARRLQRGAMRGREIDPHFSSPCAAAASACRKTRHISQSVGCHRLSLGGQRHDETNYQRRSLSCTEMT